MEKSAKADSQTKQITVRVESEPAGADVVRVEDGQLLGQTPWENQQAAAAGQMVVRLQLAGFAERTVAVNLSADAVRRETIEALPLKNSADQAGTQKTGTPALSTMRGAAGKWAKQPESQPVLGVQKTKVGGAAPAVHPAAAPIIHERPNVEE